jgi:hypothetical protein
LEGWDPVVSGGHAEREVVDDPSSDVVRPCELLSEVGFVVGLSALVLVDIIVPPDDGATGLLDSLVVTAPDIVVETSEDAACEDIDTIEDVIVPVGELEALTPEEVWVIIPLEDLADELEVPAGDEVPLLRVVDANVPLDA